MPQTLTGVNGGTFPNTCSAPLPGEFITAASVYTGEQGILNECKYLQDTKGALAVANTWTAKQTFDIGGGGGVGIETAADTTCTFNGEVSCKGNLLITSGSSQTVQSGAGFGIAEGASAFVSDALTFSGSPTTPARVLYSSRSRRNVNPDALSDQDHTVNASDSPEFVLAEPTAVRTITIEQSSDTVKQNGDQLIFWLPVPSANPTTKYWVIKREGSMNDIAWLTGLHSKTGVDGDELPGFVAVVVRSSVWRLNGGAGCINKTDA